MSEHVKLVIVCSLFTPAMVVSYLFGLWHGQTMLLRKQGKIK